MFACRMRKTVLPRVSVIPQTPKRRKADNRQAPGRRPRRNPDPQPESYIRWCSEEVDELVVPNEMDPYLHCFLFCFVLDKNKTP